MSDEAGCRHGRYAYSPLPRRTTYDWPGARRIAVYLALNVECFDFGGGLGAELAPGGPQPSFDKQFVRDYLEQIKWNKQPPVPSLPPDVVLRTREKYLEAYRRLTGRSLV